MNLVKGNTCLSFFKIALTAMLFVSCIDEYWPDLRGKYEKLLVVDGMITNQPGPYTIRLAYSSNISRSEIQPISGWEVIISDEFGERETLTETEKGIYQTAPDGIQGIVGRHYQIIINSPDNKRYESGYELLLKPTEIDKVYHEIEFHTATGYDHNLTGFQFYIDSKKMDSDTNYLLWRLEDTYKFTANYRAKYIYDNFQMEFLIPSDSLYTCWKTRKRKEIITAKTENLMEPLLLKMPLHYVTTETKEVSIRYSLLVKQLTLNKTAYDFWNRLIELEDNVSWLYAMQPYQIRGNIKNVSDESEPVLGYFMAAGVDEQRVYVERPYGLDWYYSTTCKLITEDLYELLRSMYNSWPLYLAAVYAGPHQLPALPARQYCVDCRQLGGKLTPPDFWEE